MNILATQSLILNPDDITRVLFAKDYFSTGILVITNILGEEPMIQRMDEEDIIEIYPQVNRHHLNRLKTS